jgi:hypothetical protein
MNRPFNFFLCALVIGCDAFSDSASSDGPPSNSSNSSSSNGVFSQSDLGGIWVGRLTPNDPSDRARLFCFDAASNGEVEEASDSVGNEWYNQNSNISANLLSSGELTMELSSDSGTKKLHMEGYMTNSMSSLQGVYNYENFYGVSVVGSFELILSGGAEQFANIDFSGTWSGGFGIGKRLNQRLLTFELDQTGSVISGSLTNTITGDEIHHYSEGSGSFAIDNTVSGRIDDFVLVADDGSIAECGFLMVDADMELISGVGTDSEVGAAVIEVRR